MKCVLGFLILNPDFFFFSCCVDEVAAEHVGADAIVHYGPACLSPCRKLPVLHIFGQEQLDAMRCVEVFQELYPDHQTYVVVLSESAYFHAIGKSRKIVVWTQIYCRGPLEGKHR